MTSKAEFSSESPVLFLYISSIYVATTHLATTFYKKMDRPNPSLPWSREDGLLASYTHASSSKTLFISDNFYDFCSCAYGYVASEDNTDISIWLN